MVGTLVGEALRALARRKGRTGLAAFSVATGIAAVVWVVAIGRAGARRAEEQLAALGTGLVYISAGSRDISGVRTGTHGASPSRQRMRKRSSPSCHVFRAST